MHSFISKLLIFYLGKPHTYGQSEQFIASFTGKSHVLLQTHSERSQIHP